MEQIKVLQRLGLSEYEARAYLSLAKLGPSGVKEIVMDSKIPRNKAYEALQKLEDSNRIISLPVSPKKFKITDPEVLREEANDLTESVKSLIKLIEQPKELEFKEFFWVIKSKKAIEEKLANHNLKVKREILSCNNLSKILYKNIRTMKDSISRGVKVKMICTFDEKRIHIYKEWINTGAKIRVFNAEKFGPTLPRITIFDGEVARLTIGFPEVKSEEDFLTLWTESKVFSSMLKSHFMNMWKNSEPIEKYLKKY